MSENIEYYLKKVLGKKMIIWENILYFINKLMMILLFLVFFNRPDFISLVGSVLILGLEYEYIGKFNIKTLLWLYLLSIILDFIWFYIFVRFLN